MGGILAKDEADNKEANSEDKHPGEYVMVICPPSPELNGVNWATYCEVLDDFTRHKCFFFVDGDV